jgi:two-component system NtrC family sensor kinase
MNFSFRTKLTISFSMVVFFTGLIATLAGINLIGNRVIRQAQEEVAADLKSAKEVYLSEMKCIEMVTSLTAKRFFLRDAVLNSDPDALKAEFDRIRKEECPDILTLTDNKGRVIFRTRNPEISGDSQAEDEIVKRVLRTEKPVSSTVIVSREELEKEGQDFAERAYMKIIQTPKARPSPRIEETSGMLIKAAAPVFDDEGNFIAVLYGANLINRNYEIVDKVKDMVYEGAVYKGKDIGTVTIFQKDLRISTNVRREDGTRAIGTQVSSEVYDQVLVRGKPWIGRAFVVNDWYLTAYEPIKDINGENIGMLYVGILEKKFTDIKRETVLGFLGITLAGIVLSIIIVYFLANSVTKPIKSLAKASEEISKGNLSYQVKVRRKDEIGDLESAFSQMTERIRDARDGYERALKEKVSELQQAHAHMIQSEKLASLGKLSAGVAHELNSPMTGILSFAHFIKESYQGQQQLQHDIEVVIRETERCKKIIKGLLDFARQSAPEKKQEDVIQLLNKTISLIENHKDFKDIEIIRDFDQKIPLLMFDRDQIQQVFMNLVINAQEAMPSGGTLYISAGVTQDEDYIEIKFRDTSAGIEKDNLGKIFDPFFTTKEMGTGLGLSISLGIIESHGGKLEVVSSPGEGSTFIVKLPLS